MNMHLIKGTGWVQSNSNGPLVPMVRLVPIEKDVIPVVLLVNKYSDLHKFGYSQK